jgi:hypothetical protein
MANWSGAQWLIVFVMIIRSILGPYRPMAS